MRHCLNIVSCMLLAIVVAGCQRIPLYDDEANMWLSLEIDYDIENVSEIPTPEVMAVGFYDTGSHRMTSRDFTGPEGGPVNASPGTYDILVYNFDTEYTVVQRDDYLNTIEARTNGVPSDVARRFSRIKKAMAQHKVSSGNESSRGDYTEDPLINQPDHLFVGLVERQEIPYRLDEGDIFKVHVKAATVVETFRLEITDVTGVENIYSMEAYVTGQTEALAIGQGKPAGSPATVHVPLLATAAGARSSCISSTFNTFGKYPDPEDKSYVLLHVTDYNGHETVYEYDVTDQFLDKENNGRTITVPLPIVVDPPSTEGGGMTPTVSQWDEEAIDIII